MPVPATAGGQFVAVTLTGQDVNADGILAVTVQGVGADPYWVINGLDIWTGTDPGQAPQLAAGGPATGRVGAAPLTAAELAPVVQAAVAHWAAAGLNAAHVAELNSVQYQIGTLAGGALGLTGLGVPLVRLDATAAGYGWFVDPTPNQDEEFAAGLSGEEQGLAGSAAAGRMDLLTVVEHELGHVLGLDDLSASSGDIMDASLGVGVRRQVAAADVPVSPVTTPVVVPTSPGPTVSASQAGTPVSSDSTGMLATDTSVQRARRVRHPHGRLATLRHRAAKAATPASGATGQLPPG
jgi:hypothetical protein